MTTSAGAVTERYAYTAYGVQSVLTKAGTVAAWTVNSNRHTYTGREWDDSTKLFHFRARWYEPLLGKFVGRDPLTHRAGANFYNTQFAISFMDPMGDRPVILNDDGTWGFPIPPSGKVDVCAIPLYDHGGEVFPNAKKQAEKLGVCVTRHGRKTTDGAKDVDDILYFVRECKCCKLYVLGHQGGDLTPEENGGPVIYGGAVSYPDPVKPRTPNRIFPNESFEAHLRNLFRLNKCGACVINIVTCGNTTCEHRTTRRDIARRTGCQVCGSIDDISLPDPDNETHKCRVRPCVNEKWKFDPTKNSGNTVDWPNECECPEEDLWGLPRRPEL